MSTFQPAAHHLQFLTVENGGKKGEQTRWSSEVSFGPLFITLDAYYLSASGESVREKPEWRSNEKQFWLGKIS